MVAPVRTLAAHSEFQRLNERLSEDLRLQQVHPKVGRFRLIEDAAYGVRAERQRNLLRRIAEVLARCKDGVHGVVVASQPRVQSGIRRMSRRRETSTDRREVQVLLRWQVLMILN